MPDANRLGDDLVVISIVMKVELVHDFDRLAIQRADRQQMRGQIQHQLLI